MNCPNGHANPVGNRFCLQCGVALSFSEPTPAEPILVKAPMSPGRLGVAAFGGAALLWFVYEFAKAASGVGAALLRLVSEFAKAASG